jgi:hypothetical protein
MKQNEIKKKKHEIKQFEGREPGRDLFDLITSNFN